LDERINEASISFKYILLLILIEKPGTGIFLMKEHSKLYKTHSQRKKYDVSKRLGMSINKDEELKLDDQHVAKEKNSINNLK
jgi:hypothetical protein